MKKPAHYLMVFAIFFFGSMPGAVAQVEDAISKKIYHSIIEEYLSIYTTLESPYEVDIPKFKSLFIDGDVIIDNDFFIDPGFTLERFPNPGVYINHLVTLFQLKPYKEISDFTAEVPLDKKEIMFCRQSDAIHAWIHKKIAYKIKSELREVETWVHMKIVNVNNAYKIAALTVEAQPADPDNDKVPNVIIAGKFCDDCSTTQKANDKFVNIKGCVNTDQDEDGVDDKWDKCPTEKGSVYTNGCPDSDADGIKDGEDKCQYQKGRPSNEGCPISGLTVSLSAGGTIPFGTPYAGTDVLSNQSYQWTNEGNLAREGLMFDISLEYHFSTWLGVGMGGMNFSNRFDDDRLRINIEAFLANNNLSYNHVTVTSNAYQYNMAYFKLRMGNFKSRAHQFKIEPLIGEAFNGFSKNETVIRVNYKNTGDKLNVLSFKPKPFLMYGSGVKYELGFPEFPLGLVLQAYYITGTPAYDEQSVTFANHPSSLVFATKRIQVAGASVGVQLSLSSGKEYYKNSF